jgi:hypothetical protein
LGELENFNGNRQISLLYVNVNFIWREPTAGFGLYLLEESTLCALQKP